jgi:oligopeptidase B
MHTAVQYSFFGGRYGYGSYGCSLDPYFDAKILSLVDRGWVAATACVRGGADKGRHWFLNGRLFSKKNSFTDFIAAIEHLHARSIGCKATTVTHGASAGGLLVRTLFLDSFPKLLI